MFLLFFLMVAAGMLSLLWLYFPMQGAPPQDSTPIRPPVTIPAPAAVNAADLPVPPGATVGPEDLQAAANTPDANGLPGGAAAGPLPGAVAERATATPGDPHGPGAAARAAAVAAAATGANSVEELDRQLEKLLGNAPVSPSAQPPTRP